MESPPPLLEEMKTCLACPRTGKPLTWTDGGLLEPHSGRRYPVLDGIPYLVTQQRETPALLDELFRYQRFFERLRNHKYESERLVTKIEEIKELVRGLRAYFQIIVSRLDLTRSPLVLDTGAGMMETSMELARRGARVIATDFSPWELRNPRLYSFFDDPDVDWNAYSVCDGLRPLRDDEIRFGRVLAPTERLPFLENSFDIVFTRSSLQLLKDVDAGVAEMTRVLKPGGTLAIAGECIRPPWDSVDDYLDGVLDYQEGIDDQMRTWADYARAMRRSGLRHFQAFPQFASGGKRWLRVMRRLGWRDPFSCLEGKALKGPARSLLHAMGCVVGWTAVKTRPSPQRRPLPEESDPPLADQLARFPEFEERMRLVARQSHRHLPPSFDASAMPRPDCYGFGALERSQAGPARRIFSDAALLAGRPRNESRWKLRVVNRDDHPAEIVLRWAQDAGPPCTTTLPPGPIDIILELPSTWTDAVAELVLTSEDPRLYFESLAAL